MVKPKKGQLMLRHIASGIVESFRGEFTPSGAFVFTFARTRPRILAARERVMYFVPFTGSKNGFWKESSVLEYRSQDNGEA